MESAVEQAYSELIDRIRLLDNHSLYNECSVYTGNSQENELLWRKMQEIHTLYNRFKSFDSDTKAQMNSLLLTKIEEIHKLLDKAHWLK